MEGKKHFAHSTLKQKGLRRYNNEKKGFVVLYFFCLFYFDLEKKYAA